MTSIENDKLSLNNNSQEETKSVNTQEEKSIITTTITSPVRSNEKTAIQA